VRMAKTVAIDDGSHLASTARAARSCVESSLINVISLSLASSGVMLLVRARLVGTLVRGSLDTPLAALVRTLAAGYYDLLFVACLTAPVILVSLLLGDRSRSQRFLCLFFAFLIALLVLASFANISVLKYLGKPFTYQWLYYSDFLGSMEAQQAILANVSVQFGVAVATAVLVFLGLFWVARRLTSLAAGSRWRAGAVVTLAAVLTLSYLTFARSQIGEQRFKYAIVANPVVAFA
jgi:hypothetical protein